MEKNRFTRKNILGFFKISFQISVLYSVLKFILSFLGVMLPIASAYFWKIILDDIAFPAQNKLLGLLVSVGAYSLLLVVGGVLRFCHEYIDRIYADELTLYVERKKSKPVPHTIYAISMTLNGKIATMNYRKRTSFRRTFRGSCLILSATRFRF